MNRRFSMLVVTLFAAAATVAAAGRAAPPKPVPYPRGYRSWTHVKSMVLLPENPVGEQFAGIHYVYANGRALSGLKDGRYQDGSVLVFDLFETELDEGLYGPGERKFVAVMVKNRKEYAATGGWGFEAFAKSSETGRLTSDGGEGCFLCHKDVAEADFVFSSFRP